MKKKLYIQPTFRARKIKFHLLSGSYDNIIDQSTDEDAGAKSFQEDIFGGSDEARDDYVYEIDFE